MTPEKTPDQLTTIDDDGGPTICLVESGQTGRVYQFRDGDEPGKLRYRWAPAAAAGTFGPWRDTSAELFPDVAKLLAAGI